MLNQTSVASMYAWVWLICQYSLQPHKRLWTTEFSDSQELFCNSSSGSDKAQTNVFECLWERWYDWKRKCNAKSYAACAWDSLRQFTSPCLELSLASFLTSLSDKLVGTVRNNSLLLCVVLLEVLLHLSTCEFQACLRWVLWVSADVYWKAPIK